MATPFAAFPLEVWQLPTYNGTKSYQNLLVEVYGMETYSSLRYYDKADSQVQFIPLDFIRSGYYNYGSGGIGYRSGNGYFWGSNPYNTSTTRSLHFFSTYLSPQYGDNKGNGYALRCLVPLEVVRILILWYNKAIEI